MTGPRAEVEVKQFVSVRKTNARANGSKTSSILVKLGNKEVVARQPISGSSNTCPRYARSPHFGMPKRFPYVLGALARLHVCQAATH